MILLKDVWYLYGEKPAIKEINLTLKDDITYIIGPNGSGKTTLLKVSSLIFRPARGEVLYNGENPWRDKKKLLKLRKKVVYVHEKPILLRGRVIDNVAFPLVLRGYTPSDAKDRAREILREIGLESIENKRRRELSAGQAQLVSLCRALILDAEYIFLDEPTNMLDIENREKIIELIGKKKAKKIIATHDLALPLQLTGRILLIKDGKLWGEITLDEYRSMFLNIH